MTETLAKAWSLFDAVNYTDAETLYKECYAKIPSTDHDNYWQVLMGSKSCSHAEIAAKFGP